MSWKRNTAGKAYSKRWEGIGFIAIRRHKKRQELAQDFGAIENIVLHLRADYVESHRAEEVGFRLV